jgi:hypothetical protein
MKVIDMVNMKVIDERKGEEWSSKEMDGCPLI